jgi:hypothetical protein
VAVLREAHFNYQRRVQAMNVTGLVTFAAIAAVLPLAAMAQDSVTEFRLEPAAGNMISCQTLDPSLSRVHTFTLKDGVADVRSAGGINDKMKLERPNVYDTVFELSGVRLDVVADLAATPKSLTVTEKNRGCKWLATRP